MRTEVRPVEAVVVTAPACHLCADAVDALRAADGAIIVRVVESASEEGQQLLATHRPAILPLVLVDGTLFGAGRLSRGRLHRLLEERGRG